MKNTGGVNNASALKALGLSIARLTEHDELLLLFRSRNQGTSIYLIWFTGAGLPEH
jgi:hypothetical protein